MNFDAADIVFDIANNDRETWLQQRRKGIGGSDAPSIMQTEGAFSDPYVIYQTKIGEYRDDTIDEQLAWWGNAMEPIIAERFAEETGYLVDDPKLMYRSKRWPHMQVDPDRILTHPDTGERGVLECKNTGWYSAAEWGDGTAPLRALVQTLHAMIILDLKYGYVAGCIGGNRLEFARIEWDDDQADWLIAGELDFWKLVETGTPPPISGHPAVVSVLEEIYVADLDTVVEFDADMAATEQELRDVKAVIKSGMKHRDLLSNVLKDALGTATVATYDGYPLCTWTPGTQRRVDTKQLRADLPDIAERFTRTTDTRTFRHKPQPKET